MFGGEIIKKRSLIVLVLGVLLLTAVSYGLLSAIFPVHYAATVRQVGVRVYQFPNATGLISVIDGGMFDPDTSKIYDVWVKNPNAVAENLSLVAANFNPANVSSYVVVSWNREGESILPGMILSASVTVHVLAGALGTDIESFTMDLQFIGT